MGAANTAISGLHDLLAELAVATPGATAVVDGRTRITYAELARRSDNLAAWLVEHGARPETRVGLLVDRGADLVLSLFAVLKAGAAYVPLDQDHPADRLVTQLGDAQATLLLTQRELAGKLPALDADIVVLGDEPDTRQPLPTRGTPDNLAYVAHTSGSTGQPRGVLVSHRGLLCLFAHHQKEIFGPAARSAGRRLRVAHTAALSFDAFWMPLLWMLAGHEMHLIDRPTRLDARAMVAYLRTEQIDVLDETPTYLRMLLRAGLVDGDYRPRLVAVGGEAVGPDLCAELVAAGINAYNGYGTTESTVENLVCPVADTGRTVLGRPIADTRAYVLDATLNPVPAGQCGELYLAGAGLARGYLGQAGGTAAAFVADPFGEPGSRMYRTGDLVRPAADGLLDFVGRVDDQVKIRGTRVEPGEVETILRRHPDVAAAVVVARPDAAGHDRLIGYLVGKNPEAPDLPAVRAFLDERLPHHLVPARLVALPEFPLTPHGKVDRRALPAPPDRPAAGAALVPPRNPTEKLITDIWRDHLGIEQVGVADDFVELGGDSISAMRVASAINHALNTTMPAPALFEHRTIAALATVVDRERVDQPVLGGPRADVTEPAQPLSFAQQRLWFLDEFQPGSADYNTTAGFRLRGPLRIDALCTALNGLVARHESLRTTFRTRDGRGGQVIGPPFAVPLDVRTVSGTDLDAELLAEAQRPFVLERGPLIRALLLELGDSDHLLMLSLHHIVTDGWSMGILVDELGLSYSAQVRGEPARLPTLPFRYVDFAAWQRRRLSGPVLDQQIAYWGRQLAGIAPLELPTDRPRPAVRTSAGAAHRFTVPAPLTAALTELGRHRGATLFTVLVAAAQVFLARYTGQRDIAVGTVTSGRNHAPVENLVGFFVNTTIIRSDVDGRLSFADFLRQVRSTVLDAISNDEVPFDRLVELLAPERDASRSPLVQAVVAVQNAPSPPPVLADVRVEEYDLPRQAALFDLVLEFQPHDGELRGVLEYSTELFDATTVRRMADHLLGLLAGIAGDPGQQVRRLPLLPDTAPAAPDTRAAVEERCVHDMFAEQVREWPDAPAVTCGRTTLTYAELDARANRLAHGLITREVAPDVRVGLCLPRGVDAVVAMLAVSKAGGAYVPVDPAYPAERRAFLIADSGAQLVLTNRASHAGLPECPPVLCVDDDWYADCPAQPPDSPAGPANLSYVLYTSGSTGRAKGVLVEHRSVTRLRGERLVWLGTDDVMAQFAPLSFDASVYEIWAALLSGARLVICPEDVLSPDELREFLRGNGVTTLWLTAGMFHAVVAADPDVFSGLRRLYTGGDVVAPQHCERLLRRVPHLRLYNGYGPTEGTTFSTCHRIDGPATPGVSVPIGRPVAGTSCHVLDSDGNPVPIGVTGELYLGGVGLARGYLNQPGLTARRFVADPFGSGTRLYRTGDLVRTRADGTLDFVGRMDDQVKIRGFRVELGEVEAALRRHPAVTEAVVLARQDDQGRKHLVGYAVAPGPVRTEDLRSFLETSLPGYLVPGALLVLDWLPLTSNGKLDRNALPVPRARTGDGYVAPDGADEELLARVWSEVLGVERVGANDNFFDLGGDSILSIEVVARARQRGLHVSSKDVFVRRTLAALAASASREAACHDEHAVVSGPVPLSPIQHWFFDTVTVHPERFNQRVEVELAEDVDRQALRAAVAALPGRHDALRLRFERLADGWWQEVTATAAGEVCQRAEEDRSDDFRLAAGPLIRAVLVESASRLRLVLTAHHLVVDGVSWRILLEDLRTAYRQIRAGEPVDLGPRTTSFPEWARRLHDHVAAGGFADQIAYWARATDGTPVDAGAGPSQRTITLSLAARDTAALLRDASVAWRARLDELLIAALARVLSTWTGRSRVVLELEGHGREEIFPGVDLSRSVGWFTALYPCPVEVPTGGDWATVIGSIKQQLRGVPDRGIGYGALRYLGAVDLPDPRPLARVNYLGRFDLSYAVDDLYRRAPDRIDLDTWPGALNAPRLDVVAAVNGAGELEIEWTYFPPAHDEPTVRSLAERTLAALGEIAAPGAGGYVPSDFPLVNLDRAQLDLVVGDGRRVADVYPLTPMQAGMLFHALSEPGLYVEQLGFTLTGVPDSDALRQAWQRAVDSIPALRTAVVWAGLPEPVQVVHHAAVLPVTTYDWRAVPEAEHEQRLRGLLADDRRTGMDLASPPMMRLSLIRLTDTTVRLVWTFHHLILDGWSTFGVLSEVLANLDGTPTPRRRPFADHLAWLSRQDEPAAERHWRAVLAGFGSPTRLPLDRSPGLAHRARSTSVVDTRLSVADTALLRAFARRHRITVSVVVAGMWARLLARHGGTRDVCFGVVVSGRPPELPGVDAIVGMFVNTIPVRIQVTDTDHPAEWLRRVQAAQTESRRFEHVSLARVGRFADLPAGTPLFDSIVAFDNYPLDRESLARHGLSVHDVDAAEVTNYPMNLIASGGTDDTEPLTLRLGYDPDLFDTGTVEMLAGQLVDLLAGLAHGRPEPAGITARAPAVVVPDDPAAHAHRMPRTPAERSLARIWADVLAVHQVGVADDFFALGGDSILAMKITARLRTELGVSVAPRALFDHPTIGALALLCEHRTATVAQDYEL